MAPPDYHMVEEAIAPSMPQSALQNVEVDYCLPLVDIAPLLGVLAAAGLEKGKKGLLALASERRAA